MIRIRPDNPLILVLSFVLISVSVFAETEGTPKSYPVPAAELEEVLIGWLTRSGFEVFRTSLKMGQVQLNAAKANKKWEIVLKPRSPLATEVLAGYTVDKRPDEPQLQRLWSYLSGYTKRPSMEKWDAYEGIPTVVLSRIESVVCIRARGKDQEVQFSGFIINQDGLVICTGHNLEDVHHITVILYDGQEVKGHLIRIDPRRDLALISTNLNSTAFISLAGSRNLLGMGERLYSIGCPINLRGTVVSGIISGPPRLVDDLTFWQVSMQIHPGSSGSPVFDTQGCLVAIVKGRYRGTESVGFLIPLETIMEFVTETSPPKLGGLAPIMDGRTYPKIFEVCSVHFEY